jgi:hypothetical protein
MTNTAQGHLDVERKRKKGRLDPLIIDFSKSKQKTCDIDVEDLKDTGQNLTAETLVDVMNAIHKGMDVSFEWVVTDQGIELVDKVTI